MHTSCPFFKPKLHISNPRLTGEDVTVVPTDPYCINLSVFILIHLSLVCQDEWLSLACWGGQSPSFYPKNSPEKHSRASTGKKGQDTSQAKETTDSALQNAALGALSARRCNYLSTEEE